MSVRLPLSRRPSIERRAAAHNPRGSSRRAGAANGFTLIELLVVVSLIVILESIGMANYHNVIVRAREAVLKEDLFRMRVAIDQYYADKGAYPSEINALVSDGYLRAIPQDPFTQSATSWKTIQS